MEYFNRSFTHVQTMDDGDSVDIRATGYSRVMVAASGTWASSSLSIKVSVDGATFIDAKDDQGAALTLSADGYVEIPAFPYIRLSLSSGTASGILVSVYGVY